jgi:GNAT superfamily N-acetyltransferase/uncharacterized protein (DUF1330 family)
MTVRVATPADIEGWRALARSVEALFGAAMGDDARWNEILVRNIDRGTAWVATSADGEMLGGMFGSEAGDEIGWLAVFPDARRRGAARALVQHTLTTAHGPVRVTTFGTGHPHPDAEAARQLYSTLGFVSTGRTHDGPDGTPREQFVHDGLVQLCVLLWPHPDAESLLVAYEDKVLTLLADHGGRLLSRARIADRDDEAPYEVHLLEFPSEAALDAYMRDERRVALASERERAIARTQVLRADLV